VPIDAPICYSVADAARVLSLSRRGVYRLVEHGRLRVIKLGRRTLVPASSIRALVEGGEHAAAVAAPASKLN